MARRTNTEIETQTSEELQISEEEAVVDTLLEGQSDFITKTEETVSPIAEFIDNNPLSFMQEEKVIEEPVVPEIKKPVGEKKMSVVNKEVHVIGMLRSANAFPSQYTYKGESAFIPPNGRIANVDKSLLTFPLPVGVKFVATPDPKKD